MIPLVSIGKFFISLLSIWATVKIYHSWQRTREQNLEWFYKFFIALTLIFIIFVPLPFIKNLYIIEGMLFLVDFLAFVCSAYLISIIFNFLGWARFQKILFQIVIGAGLVLLFTEVFYFRPALIYYNHFLNFTFINWAINVPIQIRIVLSVLLGGFSSFALVILLWKTLKIQESYLKYRGLFLSAGFFFFAFLALTYLIFGSVAPASFLKDIFHLTSSLLGIISILLSIYLKDILKL